MYVKSKSIHPPPIIRQLPVMINNLTFSEDEFEQTKRPHESESALSKTDNYIAFWHYISTLYCTIKEIFPLNGKWTGTCIGYKADIPTEVKCEIYYRTAESYFKSRYNNHTTSFQHKSCTINTELPKYLCHLRNENIRLDINWSVAAHASPYKYGCYSCDLCLTEKLFIARSDPKLLLNKINELTSKCRYRNKYLLSSVK